MPQRFLRPGVTTSKRFNSLEWLAQVLWMRLLTLVDDFGRYDADARLLRSHAFPYGDARGRDIPLPQLETACRELAEKQLAVFYVAEEKAVVQLLRWDERARAQKSKYPDLDDTCEQMFASVSECLPPSSSSSSSSSPLHPRHSPNGLQKPSEPPDEVWLEGLNQNPAYEGIDVIREHGKMLSWCSANRKTATRRRFVNWLNKCERPLRAVNFKRQQPLDPAKINVAPEFIEWACGKYPARNDDIRNYRTWRDVPEVLRAEWKREKINPLSELPKTA